MLAIGGMKRTVSQQETRNTRNLPTRFDIVQPGFVCLVLYFPRDISACGRFLPRPDGDNFRYARGYGGRFLGALLSTRGCLSVFVVWIEMEDC